MRPCWLTRETEPSESTPILGTEQSGCCKDVPARFSFSILSFFGIFNAYTMRVNLSVAMVAMVLEVQKTVTEEADMACQELITSGTTTNITMAIRRTTRGEFAWDPSTQGLILGSFFYGYVVTQIPGGIIAERFGAKWPFGIGILVTAVCTLLTPLAARHSVGALITVRIIEGLGEGLTFPAMNALIGRWSPKLERSRTATIIFSGSPIGTVVGMAGTGVLCSSTFLGGWPSAFYVFGTLGCIWFVLWIAFIYDSPDDHPHISKSELIHIHEGQDLQNRPTGPIPWRRILTSKRVIALIITHFGYNWGFYTLLTELPTYLSNILHFDLQKNGTLSALPYLAQAFFAYGAGIAADKLRGSGFFTITSIRKFMNSVAFYGPALIVLCIAFVGCRPIIIVILLTISIGLNGFIFSGFNVTHVDMSPEYAGTLMGITNCVANISGFLAPNFVGLVTASGQTVANWSFVFVASAAVYFITGTVYNLFASAEPQPWGMAECEPSRENPTTRRTSVTEKNVTPESTHL